MIRTGFLTLAFGIVTAVLASAQDEPGKLKKVPVDLIKEIPELELKKDKGKDSDAKDAKGESPKEIIERLHKNMELANVHLKDKGDPSEGTRKIQTNIIDDLDKLIKQEQDRQSKSESGGGGGGGGGAATAGGKGGGGKKKEGGKKDEASAKKKEGGGKDDKKDKDVAKGKEKDDKDKGGKKDDHAKGKKGGNDGGGGGDSPVGKAAIVDRAREVWGELPRREREQVDALPGERYLPQYQRLLEKYYRTAGGKDR